MTKDDFLIVLANKLQELSKEEQDKFLSFYEEMIEDYKEDGYEEEEAVKKVGKPSEVAENILNEADSITINMPSTGNSALNIILLIVGFPLWGSLLLAILLLVASAYCILWCLPIITGSISLGSCISGLFEIIGVGFVMTESVGVGIIQLGLGITCIGIAILSGMATLSIAKKISTVSRNFTNKMISIYRKRVVRK